MNDMERSIEENPDDDSTGVVGKDKSIFPETKRGRATAGDYVVLTPEA